MSEKLSVATARQELAIGKNAKLQGWVRTRRDSKAGFSFIEINNGSSQGNIQIVAPGEMANYESDVKSLTAGCSITAIGEIKESGGRGQVTRRVGVLSAKRRSKRVNLSQRTSIRLGFQLPADR